MKHKNKTHVICGYVVHMVKNSLCASVCAMSTEQEVGIDNNLTALSVYRYKSFFPFLVEWSWAHSISLMNYGSHISTYNTFQTRLMNHIFPVPPARHSVQYYKPLLKLPKLRGV